MNRNIRIIILILNLLFFMNTCTLHALTLVKNGMPTSVIVIDNNPLEVHTKAAAEFQEHLRLMSDTVIPIVQEKNLKEYNERVLILIGQSDLALKHGVDTTKLDKESFLIKTGEGVLIIAGDDGTSFRTTRTGTLWAVYDFLQDQLGVRWIWPGETGRYVPRQKTVIINSKLDITETPILIKRWMRLMTQSKHKQMYLKAGLDKFFDMDTIYDQLSVDESQWATRMRMGRSMYFSYGHAFTTWWEKYHESHPGIFALTSKGKRAPNNRPDFVKMCVSNPELWKMQLDAFKNARRDNPDIHFLNASENDGKGGFCTCERCRAWDTDTNRLKSSVQIEDGSDITGVTPEKEKLPDSLSDRYARWYNELAVRARTIDPEAIVVAYAYNKYRDAPTKLQRIEPNIWIGFVGYNHYPMTAEKRKYWNDQWLGWSDKGASLFLRSNSLYMCAHGTPYVFSYDIAKDWRFLIKHKMIATDFDCLKGYWATTGPTYYVLARLQWDTNESVDNLLNEYYEAFGPAAPVVREYFEYWEEFTGSLKENTEFINSSRADKIRLYPQIYTDEVIGNARTILDKALPVLKQAPTEFRERFRNIELGIEHTVLFLEAMKDGTIENGTEGKALMDFRRKYASRNVINPYFITYFEISHRLF